MNTKVFNECGPAERFIIEWQYGMLGGFKAALIEAIGRADEGNLTKLALGFPEEVDGYRMFSRKEDWWPDLQQRAELP